MGMKDSLRIKRDELANKVAEEVFGEYETLEEEEANSFIGMVSDFSKGFDACHSLMEDEVRGLEEALANCHREMRWALQAKCVHPGGLFESVTNEAQALLVAMRSQAEGVGE
jgi:hypothetical protein